MTCWFCHYGWPKPIADVYDRFVATAGEHSMHFGPAHVVWEDENFERHHVQWCLDHADEFRHEGDTEEEHEAVVNSLRALLELPLEELCATADRYQEDEDGSLENYPPPPDMTMVQR